MLENDGSASWGCPEGTKVLSNYSSVAEVFYVRGNFNQHEMAEGRINDGLLRHPAYSLAWQKFDEIHPWFASDPRNVRLGLATDGFNPFGAFIF